MGPAALGAQPLPRAIACAGGNGARRPRLLAHEQIRIGRAVWRCFAARQGFDGHRRQQAGGNQGGTKIINLARIIQLAGLKAAQQGDMVGIEGGGAQRQYLAEIAARPGRDGQRVIAGAQFAVEQDIALAKLGKRIAIFGKFDRDIGLGRNDGIGHNRIAGGRNEIARDQVDGLNRRRVQGDGAQKIAAPGDDVQHYGNRVALFCRSLGRHRDGCIEKAFARQYVEQQLAIRARTGRSVRPAVGAAVVVGKGR